jgi:hypothetical protein
LRKQEPDIEWNDYPRLDPSVYLGYCSWAGKYYDPQFQHWTCLLRWTVVSEDLQQTIAKSIPQWFRLGGEQKPHASRRGKYLGEWARANGGPPSKNDRLDRLSPRVFTRRLARIEIGDAKSPVPYSIVKRIVSWETGEKSPAPLHTVVR